MIGVFVADMEVGQFLERGSEKKEDTLLFWRISVLFSPTVQGH